jgi:chromosome segregation ATPase
MSRRMEQLDMFGTAQERELRAEVAWLRSRLEQAKVEFRRLRAELHAMIEHEEALRSDLMDARRTWDAAQLAARIYRSLAEYNAARVQEPAPSSPVTDQVLKELLSVAHPDRWHGQPATTLAHEICVALNAAREKLEVRP